LAIFIFIFTPGYIFTDKYFVYPQKYNQFAQISNAFTIFHLCEQH